VIFLLAKHARSPRCLVMAQNIHLVALHGLTPPKVDTIFKLTCFAPRLKHFTICETILREMRHR
jgi:hypothetical protein